MTAKSKREQQLLDFAAAEGQYRERLYTLGNLTKVVSATCVQANVLRFIFEEGGLDRPVELVLPRIAGSPWIQSCENTVRKAIAFWESGAIIEIERGRREGDKQAPNAARLLWSSVRRRLLGEGRFAGPLSADSAGRSERPSERSDPRFFSAAQIPVFEDPATILERPDTILERPDTSFCSLEVPFSRNPIRVLACARGLLSLSSVCTVVDDVSKDRRVEFLEIWELAEEARRPLYPGAWPKDPQAKEAFVAGSVLASMLFSSRWLLHATRATQRNRGGTPWRYWLGCLRNGLTESEGLEPLGTQDQARSYFATLMAAAAPIAAEVIAEFGSGELVPVAAESHPQRPPLENAVDPAANKKWRETLARHQAAKQRQTRPAAQGGATFERPAADA